MSVKNTKTCEWAACIFLSMLLNTESASMVEVNFGVQKKPRKIKITQKCEAGSSHASSSKHDYDIDEVCQAKMHVDKVCCQTGLFFV